MGEDRKPRGRPARKIVEPIPDTFENVIKALVAPRKKEERDSSNDESKS